MAGYDISALGWLLFERLATDAVAVELGIPASAWQGASDGEREAVWDKHLKTLGVAGPSALQMVWIARSDTLRNAVPIRLQEAVGERFRAPVVMRGKRRRAPIVVTNLDEDDVPAEPQMRVLGAHWLSAALERSGALRLRHPCALGVREGGAAIKRVTASFDLAGASALARAFVEVRAYDRALAVLQSHHFAVLTGPPEMGKTAIARMLALGLASDGWEAHECLRPEDVFNAWDDASAQLFVADDAFGSTEYRPDAAERWAREMERLLRRLDERHWLVWTSRPAPLRAGLERIHRERGAERFPLPAEVLVDAEALDLSEKALILLRHAQAAGASGTGAARLLREHGPIIVEDPHFTPERIRRLIAQRLFGFYVDHTDPSPMRAILARELREPTEAMAASFAALDPEHRAVLVAMLDCPPGPVAERDLATAARRQADGGLPRAPANMVDRLADHFLRVVDTRIAWVHPSWRDLVIDQLTADTAGRRAFLQHAGLDGVLLGLSVHGGRAGERLFPLLVDDRDWDLLADRLATLVRDADEHDAMRVLLAINAAFGAKPRPMDLRELCALGSTMLGALARRWERAGEPLAIAAITEWLELARWTGEAPAIPQLERTWIALLPRVDAAPPTADLRQADEWLWLVEVLFRLRRDELFELGFPHENLARLHALVAASYPPRDEPDRARVELGESIRGRLLRLPIAGVPQPAPAASAVSADLGWVQFAPAADHALQEPVTYGLIDRILRDL